MQSLNQLIQPIQIQQPTTKANDMISEIAEKYEPYIIWDNTTYLGKNGDRSRFYTLAHEYEDHHGLAKFKDLLEWIKKKDCLHPKQVFKVLQK